MTPGAAAGVALALALALGACGPDTPDGSTPATTAATTPSGAPSSTPDPVSVAELLADPDGEVARLEPRVVGTVAHDPDAFTQGLEEHDGVLVESTGRYGRSDRRRVDLATGEVLASEPLPDDHFGEGLTVVGDRLIQLTWQEGIAHVADADTLAPLDTWRYDGEGWGLCHDGDRLVMSDGSATLRFRDADTFTETGAIEVARDGEPVTRLNELECDEGVVWANVWGATDIVAIDPASGEVRAVVDASALVPDGVDGDAVLNGIARRPGRETFWLTGKLWPVLYEVELIPAGGP